MKISRNLKVHLMFGVLVSGILLLMIHSSCEKEETSDFVKVAEVAAVHLEADLEATYLFSVLHKAIYDTAMLRTDTAMIDSAWVYRTAGSPSGQATYLFDYGDSTVSPDFDIKSGQIEATLDRDFSEDSATFIATFDNFTINNLRLEGTATYANTGEISGGRIRLQLETEIDFYKNEQKLITYTGNKTIWWAGGFDEPEIFDSQKFAVSGFSNGDYTDPSNTDIPEAVINLETENELEVRFSCHKLIRSGRVFITESLPEYEEIITGDFIDSDIDGCSDKVMLKNPENFGYPYYF